MEEKFSERETEEFGERCNRGGTGEHVVGAHRKRVSRLTIMCPGKFQSSCYLDTNKVNLLKSMNKTSALKFNWVMSHYLLKRFC